MKSMRNEYGFKVWSQSHSRHHGPDHLVDGILPPHLNLLQPIARLLLQHHSQWLKMRIMMRKRCIIIRENKKRKKCLITLIRLCWSFLWILTSSLLNKSMMERFKVALAPGPQVNPAGASLESMESYFHHVSPCLSYLGCYGVTNFVTMHVCQQ